MLALEISLALSLVSALFSSGVLNGEPVSHKPDAQARNDAPAPSSGRLEARTMADDPIDPDVRQAQDAQVVRPDAPLRPAMPVPEAARELLAGFDGPGGSARSIQQVSAERRERASRLSTDVLLGSQSRTRPATDLGSLLGKSQTTLGVETQKRTPIVTDTRVRGTHVGQSPVRGSYWIPARQDLDTMVSKLDSSIISDVLVVKGPYSAIYGPGFSFIDTQLLTAPRYADGPEWHGRSSLNYQSNGDQWFGRQTILGGSTDWGMRVGYGHRTGNDYETGDGGEMPSSYKSRDIDAALGFDLSECSRIEFSYLRLDQTDVEFPGQIFDIDFLVTDAFEVKYVLENQCYFDQLNFDTWYNRTRFEGNAQRAGKREQIPELNCSPLAAACFYAPARPGGELDFFGLTDVDAMSTGFRLAASWGDVEAARLTAGVDLRYVKQRLNETDLSPLIQSAPPPVGPLDPETNFPIPDSYSSNPGLFVEHVVPLDDGLTVRSGVRLDFVATNADRRVDRTLLEPKGGGTLTDDLETVLGGSFDQEFYLGSLFATAEYQLDCCWTASAGAGFAMRPPTLTELYSAQSFLAILQQGFTFVSGDPELDPEQIYQIDLGLKGDYGCVRTGISGFYAWVPKYITYEADFLFGAGAIPDALGVHFTNTDLATLAGGEAYAELDWNEYLTPFARVRYVEGRDESLGRRGLFGDGDEPLPGIAPLESRLGVRLHEPGEQPRWGLELTARVVDNQDRVAASLLERQTPGFTTWDLRGYWRADEGLLLVAGVENFTDKHYREHLDLRTGRGVFQPGASFYMGMELTY
jgi:outer membrane receptor protein involved in Fe transport